MSTKDGTASGKSLKGGRGANSGISTNDIVGVLTGGTPLVGIQLEDVSIFTGDFNDVTIGSVIPSNGIFKNLLVGINGAGGNFKILGSRSDDNDNPLDYIEWEKNTGILNLYGGITVRDASQFGNIIIRDNDILALNTDGDINLIPNSSNSAINIKGNLFQYTAGTIKFEKSTTFSVLSQTQTLLSSVSKSVLSSQKGGNVELNSDFNADPVNISIFQYNASGSFVTTVASHNLVVGQEFSFSGIQTLQNTYIVLSIITTTRFRVTVPPTASFTNNGSIVPKRSGTVNIFAGTSVSLRDKVPLKLGDFTSITSNKTQLLITSPSLYLSDPIQNVGSGVTDSGSVCNSRFFGISQGVFTYIPESVIVLLSSGAKNVSGLPGTANFGSVITNIIKGNPNLLLDAAEVQVGNLLRLGASSSISIETNNLTLSCPGALQFVSSKVSIPQGISLSFSTLSSQTITGSENGLVFSGGSFQGPVHFNGDIKASQIGGENLSINPTGNLYLSPSRLILPENIFFQIGGDVNTGIISKSNGKISIKTTTDFLLHAERVLTLTSTAGVVNITTNQVQFPGNVELLFGLGNSLLLLNGITKLSSKDNLILVSEKQIHLLSTVYIPDEIELKFGLDGKKIYGKNNKIFIQGGGLDVACNVVINGSLVINGPSTTVSSTTTTIADPVISLGTNTPIGDVKSRGFDFIWSSGNVLKTGFIGLNTAQKIFVMSLNGSSNLDVYTPTELGSLLLDTVFTTRVNTTNLNVSVIKGIPDIELQCDVFKIQSSKILIPVGIQTLSGRCTIGTTFENTFQIGAEILNLPGGKLVIGSAVQLVATDLNSFHIGGVTNIFLDASKVTISSSLDFGTTGVSITAESSTGNIRFNSLYGGNSIFAGVGIFEGGLKMGNSFLKWSSTGRPGGQVEWINTVGTLDLSIAGNIHDASWYGTAIDIAHGGTGHSGEWHSKSIVFVGNTSVFLDEDYENFVYNRTTRSLGIRSTTLSSENAITIGSGDVYFSNSDSRLNFGGNYTAGKLGKHYAITSLESSFVVNPFGQVGIRHSIPYMNALVGGQTSLYVSGNIRSDGMYFSDTEYITSKNNSLSLNSSSNLVINASVILPGLHKIYFENETNFITSSTSVLEITSSSIIRLNAIVQIESTLSLHSNINGTVEIFIKNESSLLLITNTVGDIKLDPASSIIIPNDKSILLGSNGSISCTPFEMNLVMLGNQSKISLNAQRIDIKNGSKLTFSNSTLETSGQLYYDSVENNIILKSSLTLNLIVPTVLLPGNTSLVFGRTDTKINSILGVLQLYGADNVNVLTKRVNLMCNIVAIGSTTTITQNESSTLEIVGVYGIDLKCPSLSIPNLSNFYLGSNKISSSDTNLNIYASDDVNFYAKRVNINCEIRVVGATGTASIKMINQSLSIGNGAGILLDTNTVALNTGSSIYFGGESKRISSTLDSLQIFSPNLIDIVSNTVRITGNLLVTEKSTFTIESETSFDSGIIDLGGGQMCDITLLESYGAGSTLVTLNAIHSLKIGDSITVYNSIPDIDGEFIINKVPTPTTIVITKVYPGTPLGAVAPFGRIRTKLVRNPGNDVGVQINWHDGISAGTESHHVGFFGFRRSSKCFVYIPNATRIDNNFYGDLGSFCIGSITADTITTSTLATNTITASILSATNGANIPTLLGPLNTAGYLVSGNNFVISGGTINGTVIGNTVATSATFTDVKSNTITASNTVTANTFLATIGANIPTLLGPLNTTGYLVSGSNFVISGGSINGTVIGNTIATSATFTDVKSNTITASNLTATNGANIPALLGPLNTAGYLVSGNNFVISGGSINGTVIGNTIATSANFTNVSLKTLIVESSDLVVHLNADRLDGHHSTDFVTTDGSSPLTANWNVGNYGLTVGSLNVKNLQSMGILYVDEFGKLSTSNLLYINQNTLYTSGINLQGTVQGNTNVINNVKLTFSDITLGATNTIDVSMGNIIFAPDQISGNYIAGGEANIDITGQSKTVVDGLYRHDYNNNNSILKADVNGTPTSLSIPEGTVLGRVAGDVIKPISFNSLLDLIGGVKSVDYSPNSILYSNSQGTISSLIVGGSTVVGRNSSGEIKSLTAEELREIIGVKQQQNNSSFERFSILTGEDKVMSTGVETSYLMINYSVPGGRLATCTLGNGSADGHRKIIIISSCAVGAVLQVNCKFHSVNTVNPVAFIFVQQGQSVQLQWDTVMDAWYGINTGAGIVTEQDLLDPNWLVSSGWI